MIKKRKPAGGVSPKIEAVKVARLKKSQRENRVDDAKLIAEVLKDLAGLAFTITAIIGYQDGSLLAALFATSLYILLKSLSVKVEREADNPIIK